MQILGLNGAREFAGYRSKMGMTIFIVGPYEGGPTAFLSIKGTTTCAQEALPEIKVTLYNFD